MDGCAEGTGGEGEGGMDAAEKFGVFGDGMTIVLEGCAY